MKSSPVSSRTGAFTLIELLCVMAIIAILAALLLPVLSQGESRAKLAFCGNNLGQVGLGFQMFAHDHDSRFPLQVPAAQGGAAESAQDTNGPAPEIYFSPENYQAMAAELGTPNILVCPADNRRPAATFARLQAANLSYFTDGTADYSAPGSVLAGDRNVAVDAAKVSADGAQTFAWTIALHRFKGNLLYADGHVAEARSFLLAGRAPANPASPGAATAALTPEQNTLISTMLAQSVPGLPTAGLWPAIAGELGHPEARPAAATNAGALVVAPEARSQPILPNGGTEAKSVAAATPGSDRGTLAVTSEAAARTTARPAATPTADDVRMNFFERHHTRTAHTCIVWGYCLLLLLDLAWMAWRTWRRLHRPQAAPTAK